MIVRASLTVVGLATSIRYLLAGINKHQVSPINKHQVSPGDAPEAVLGWPPAGPGLLPAETPEIEDWFPC